MRRLFTNGIWGYVLQATNALSSFVLVPFLTRSLGAESFGLYSTLLNFVTYFTVFTLYGFEIWAARRAGEVEDSLELASLFWHIQATRALLLVPATLAWVLYIWTWSSDDIALHCGLLMAITLVGNTFSLNWLFLGVQRLKLAALAAVGSKVPFVIAVFFFVKTPVDVGIYCLIFGLTALLSVALQFSIAVTYLSIPLARPTMQGIRELLQDAWSLFLSNALSTVLVGCGVTVLSLTQSASEVGGYTAVSRVPQLALFLFAPISTSLFPVSCERYRKSRTEGDRFAIKSLVLVLPVFVALNGLVVVFRDPLSEALFGPSFSNYSGLLVPLSLWALLGILANFCGIQMLVASGRDAAYSKILFVATVSTVIFGYCLSVSYGTIGVAWGVVVGEGVGVLFMVVTHCIGRFGESVRPVGV